MPTKQDILDRVNRGREAGTGSTQLPVLARKRSIPQLTKVTIPKISKSPPYSGVVSLKMTFLHQEKGEVTLNVTYTWGFNNYNPVWEIDLPKSDPDYEVYEAVIKYFWFCAHFYLNANPHSGWPDKWKKTRAVSRRKKLEVAE